MFLLGEEISQLRTERLRLRIPARTDLDRLNAAIEETIDELSLWLPWAHCHQRWVMWASIWCWARILRALRTL